MMRIEQRLWVSTCVLVLLPFLADSTQAGVVPIGTDILGNLVGGSPTAATDLMVTGVSNGNLVGDIYSRAYTGDNGLYAYLYQVDNTGAPGNSSVEMFTLWPFAGADDTTNMGYLSDLSGMEAGEFYAAGGYPPENVGFVDVLTTGPEVSFYYTKRFGGEIPPGAHSEVLYVMSELGPAVIVGNVIDGSVGSGPVVGPISDPIIPEPAVLVHVVLGSLAALAFAGYRRRQL